MTRAWNIYLCSFPSQFQDHQADTHGISQEALVFQEMNVPDITIGEEVMVRTPSDLHRNRPAVHTSYDFIDEIVHRHRTFLIDVNGTIKHLLQQEDTDRNIQITIDDNGPKVHMNISRRILLRR